MDDALDDEGCVAVGLRGAGRLAVAERRFGRRLSALWRRKRNRGACRSDVTMGAELPTDEIKRKIKLRGSGA